MLAYYTMTIAKEGYIGLALANAKARVSVPGVKAAITGTNPISIAIPTKKDPIVLDMALSIVPIGKIVLALRRGEKIPEGWALNKNGEPTTDPVEAFQGYLLPIGRYKGLALAIIIDILCSVFIGAPYGLKIHGKGAYTQGGFIVAALKPNIFRNYYEVLEELEEFITAVKSLPKSANVEIMMPGEPEMRCYKKRLEKGIPIEEEVWEKVLKFASELGVGVEV